MAALDHVEAGPIRGHFMPVRTANGVIILDFIDSDDLRTQHYSGQGEICRHYHGGRGVYFDDPVGHRLEFITKPYGETPAR